MFLNPFTDFGFKKIFGEESNKDLLIDFLNQLLPSHHQIKTLTYKKMNISDDSILIVEQFLILHAKIRMVNNLL
jgi:hypothetical protein